MTIHRQFVSNGNSFQRTIFNVFYQHILNLCSSGETANERAVLLRVLSLYGGNILVGHGGILCEVCTGRPKKFPF